MSSIKKSSLLNQFSTKDELNNLDTEKLYSIAKKSIDFREFIIDFILGSGFMEAEKENLYLNDLEMSVALRNSLRKGNFNTLNELTLFSKNKLKDKIEGFGEIRLEELVIIMKKHGLKFAEIDKLC